MTSSFEHSRRIDDIVNLLALGHGRDDAQTVISRHAFSFIVHRPLRKATLGPEDDSFLSQRPCRLVKAVGVNKRAAPKHNDLSRISERAREVSCVCFGPHCSSSQRRFELTSCSIMPATPGGRRGITTAATSSSAGSVQIEFQEGLARAQALEQQLTAATATNSSSNKQAHHHQTKQIRFSLCEVLSHLILLSPALAATERLPDRLWSTCFYDRCKAATNTIAKSKAKKNATTSASTAIIITPEWEASWKSFVEQSITLYAYLVDAMKAKLADGLKRGSSTRSRSIQHRDDDDDSLASVTSTQSTADDDMDKENGNSQASQTASTDGVVPCLTRLYIHLGDLYRYSSQTQKAEVAYQQSALLAPGHGNAYNQLAVVTHQHSDHLAVALFWYIRALAATSDAFGPAAGNLQRLFKDNAKVLTLMKQQEEASTRAANATAQGNSVQILKPTTLNKTLLSKRFLTELVDLQRAIASAAADTSAMADDQLELRIDHLTALFTDLLQQSVFGEGLLIKVVCIQAQGEYAAQRQLPPETAAKIVPIIQKATMKLANALAERVLSGLSKQLEQQQQKKASTVSLSSVKLLLPLLLLAEYAYHAQVASPQRHDQDVVASGMGNLDSSSEAFWIKTIAVMNRLKDLANVLELAIDFTGSAKGSRLKQYQQLCGFGPFQSFMGELDNGYVSDRDAMDLLHLHDDPAGTSSQASMLTSNTSRSHPATQESLQSSSSLRTNITSGATAQSWDEARAKVSKFLYLGEQLAQDTQSPVGKQVERSILNSQLIWQATEKPVDDMSEDDRASIDRRNDDAPTIDDDNGNVRMDDDEDDAGDVIIDPPALVYKTDVMGGMSLLVPAAFSPEDPPAPEQSKNAQASPMDIERVTTEVRPMETPTDYSNIKTSPMKASLPPPGMSPPPGFGSTAAPPMSAVLGVRPSDTQHPATNSVPFPGQRQPMYLFESPLLFGNPSDYQTANPFAEQISFLPVDAPANDFMVDMFASGDGSSLLGSGLLSSILSDDAPQKSRNPFA